MTGTTAMDKPLSLFQANEAFKDTDTVCYCFGYTKRDIEHDGLDHDGRSTILERIIKGKHAGGCKCAQANPKGH
jgi:hypothetical protein